jgi:hypothetical protein
MEVSMRLMSRLVIGPLAIVTALSAPAYAQEPHAVAPAALAAAVEQHVAGQEADRATIHDALNRPEVREIAAKAGVDLGRVSASVDTLTGGDLQRAAAAAQQVNHALIGGANTIVISTTTIIIALLILLLIIVAVD